MNRNIELGTFTWDTNKLSDQIAANYLEMQRLNGVMRDGNKIIKQSSDAIKDLEKKIESEHRAQQRLNEQLENGHITQEKYNEEIAKSNEKIDEFIDQQQEAIKAQADYAIEVTRTQQEIRALRQEQGELNNLLAAGRNEVEGNEGAYKALNRELNALKQEAKNLGAEMILLERAGQQDTDQYRNLAARLAEATAAADELNDQFVDLDASVGDNQRSVGNYKEAISEAFAGITGGIQQMASGNVKGGFESVMEGFKGMKTAAAEAYTFIMANPLVALVAAFLAIGAGIYKGVEAMIDYNESIKENKKLTEDLTKTSGALADQIRIRAQALTDTFGGDFEETLKTANTLAKQLGITYEEAFDKIEQGYIRGANANGDFLDRLSEYGPLLNKYGFNLDQIIGLQIQSQQQGLFGDKFEDSIKEAGLSLEEFTKAQTDAISNAFGPEFANKISHDVNAGTITVKDALILMSAEAKKQGLSVQQFGVLTADVFKGAGEDIGGAQVMFENIYKGINKLEEPLTAVQQKTLELSKANLELASAKDEALKSDKLMAFMSNWDMFLVQTETIFYKFISLLMDGISWIDKITGTSELLSETWDALKDNVNTLWKFIETLAGVFNDLFDALGLSSSGTESYLKSILKTLNPLSLLKAGLQLAAAGVKGLTAFIDSSRVSLTAFAITAKSVFAQIADAARSFMALDFEGGLKKLKDINISKEYEKARKEAEKIVALNKAAKPKIVETTPEKESNNASDKNKGTTQADRDAAAKAAAEAAKKAAADAKAAETKRIAEAKRAAEEAKKALEEETKRAIELARNEAEQKSEIAKIELANYIANNAEKLKNDKTLLQSKLDAEIEYYNRVRDLQQQANNAEEVSKIQSIQQKIDEIDKKKELNKNDLEERKLLLADIDNVHREYYNKEIELNNTTNEKKKELNKKFEEDVQEQRNVQQAISFQQKIIDLESQHAIESEIQRVQLDADTEQRLEQFLKENELKRQLDQEDYDINAEIKAQRTELENQIALINDENEKLRLQNKLGELNVIQAGYSQKTKEIDDALTDSKLEGFATVFGAAKSALGEQTAVGKAAAIAETTINTYKAAQAAYTSLAGIPIIGPALGAVAAGFAIVQGLANVRKIVSVKTEKAADGMLIGPSHANGGIPIMTPSGMIEAEGGEVIINKRSSALYRNELSAINSAGGGVKFANGGVINSNLATVQNSITQSIDFTAMADIIGEKVAEGSAIGTSNGSQAGFENLSENRKIANGVIF